jgi:DNA repair exonuclease SbcCD nuclease subunit
VSGVSQLGGDALLIVGDVFDHARVPDRVLEFFVEQMSKLEIPAVVLPGNHDLYDESSLYLRGAFQRKSGNLHILCQWEGQLVSFPQLTLDIWGRAMPEHSPDFRPLAGMPHNHNGHWLVALAHGHFHFTNDTDRRSSPIYPHEVAAATCDYLALGHWERHVDVSQGTVKAAYSGSPLGASHNDDAVSVTVVDLDPQAGVLTHQAALMMKP